MKAGTDLLPYLVAELEQIGGSWHVADGVVRHQNIVVHANTEVTEEPGKSVEVHAHISLHLDHFGGVEDCSAGGGVNYDQAFRHIAQLWANTTGAAVVELITQSGLKAQRFRPEGCGGLPGWHCIVSPAAVMFTENREHALTAERWLKSERPLDAIKEVLQPFLGRGPHGVKLFIGAIGNIVCEVQVDGKECEPASQVLAQLPGPPIPEPFAVRLFCLLLFQGSA